MIRRQMLRTLIPLFAALLVSLPAAAAPSQALGYTPKYPPGFDHFDYVNPDAPKGGRLVLSDVGSYDGFNPFILKSIPADGVLSLMFDTLMQRSLDEPFSQYGLLADDVKAAPDGLSVTFHLNPRARFSDGTPVTAADVKFSFDTLKSKQAHPRFRFYWADIKRAVVLGPRTVRFEFARVNPELRLIIGELPVFSRRWVGARPFNQVVMQLPIGSGPYLIDKYDLGKYITFRRNPNYWAHDLGVRRGMYNFGRITIKYYRDFTVRREAFKAGEFDYLSEYNSKAWARDYTGPKFDDGRILKATFANSNDAGMQGFVFNLRRPLFKDRRVREAIALAMDFEWDNHKLFYDQYTRCDSYFSNSELASSGIPKGAELKLLEPFREQLPPELFSEPFRVPSTAPPGSLRKNLVKAKRLLEAAGWHYRDGALRNAAGEPFHFSIMLGQAAFERIVAPFARNLAKLGITIDYRTVDPAIYQQRGDNFDYDMVVGTFGESQSPGNELVGMFGSSSANQPGSQNIMGLKNPVVDALIKKVIYAPDRAHLVTAVHALDRVLLWGWYVVPNWYIAVHRVAYWNKFGIPAKLPLYYQARSWSVDTWWAKSAAGSEER